MGDSWLHRIKLAKRFEADADARLPRFLRGARRTPPEDVGGPGGFAYFLAALADPKHRGHRDMTEWHEDPFDAEDIDEATVHRCMAVLAKARGGR